MKRLYEEAFSSAALVSPERLQIMAYLNAKHRSFRYNDAELKIKTRTRIWEEEENENKVKE